MTIFTDLYHYIFYEPTYNMLMFIYGVIHSFPVAIVLMTIVLRSLLVPLFVKQLQSQKRMQEISPMVEEIKKQYKGDPAGLNRATMDLYKENNVNPYAGCLPTIVQLPFLWGMYGAFNAILNGTTKITVLNSDLYPFVKPVFGSYGLTHLPNNQFFGINLAHPDPTLLLPIFAGLFTFISMRMSTLNSKKLQSQQSKKPAGQSDPNAMSMQMMSYMMPVLTFIMGLRFAAGLALYWNISTMFTIGQQYFVNGRNFGGLFASIPWFSKPAVVPAVVDGSLSSASRFSTKPPSQTVVREEKPRAIAAPAKPAPISESAQENTLNGKETPSSVNSNKETSRSSSTQSKLAAQTPRKEKDVVRFIATPNQNGAKSAKPIAPANAIGITRTKTPTRPLANTPKKTNAAKGKNSNNSAVRKKK